MLYYRRVTNCVAAAVINETSSVYWAEAAVDELSAKSDATKKIRFSRVVHFDSVVIRPDHKRKKQKNNNFDVFLNFHFDHQYHNNSVRRCISIYYFFHI